jgi:RNA polymerase sigma-70 factor (ECF subfamily)
MAGDEELAERARRGSGEAWSEVYRLASPGLRARARRQGADRDEADDIVSEVFARAVNAVPGYRPDGPLVAWLYGIQRNVMREHRRRPAAAPVGLDVVGALDRTARPVEEDPAMLVMHAMDAALAVAAMRSLDERTRRIVYLRVCERRSSAEVAALVGANPAAVRMAQTRAVRRLRTALPAAS